MIKKNNLFRFYLTVGTIAGKRFICLATQVAVVGRIILGPVFFGNFRRLLLISGKDLKRFAPYAAPNHAPPNGKPAKP
jgi:hypothetical protein